MKPSLSCLCRLWKIKYSDDARAFTRGVIYKRGQKDTTETYIILTFHCIYCTITYAHPREYV